MAEKKSNCAYCGIASQGHEHTLYNDKQAMAILAEKPACPGHIQLFLKSHYTIFEHVPDTEVSYLFSVANKLSTAAFEALGMQGTNIVITNGVAAGQKHAHLLVNILPRMENDGVELSWAGQQLSEEEMSTVEMKLKERAEAAAKPEEKKVIDMDKKKAKDIKEGKDEENYLLRSLERIP